MKRVSVLLMAVLLLLTGCANKADIKNISVKDACCPYKIQHKKDAVEITLEDGGMSDLLWQTEMIPEDVCETVQINAGKEGSCRYRVTGLLEGAAQLRFTALQEESAVFTLSLVIHVDEEGKTRASSCQHWEKGGASVEADGLNYSWSVDENGVLQFSFINSEDFWSVRENEQEICTLSDKMATPGGCKFSAEAKSAGETDILLIGETTQREIHVTIQVDADGNLKVTSVQEQ